MRCLKFKFKDTSNYLVKYLIREEKIYVDLIRSLLAEFSSHSNISMVFDFSLPSYTNNLQL